MSETKVWTGPCSFQGPWGGSLLLFQPLVDPGVPWLVAALPGFDLLLHMVLSPPFTPFCLPQTTLCFLPQGHLSLD